MKSLSAPLSAALGAAVQQPALLIEIGFATPQRWSSFATLTWNAQTWTANDVRLESLQVNALQVQGAIVIGNLDDAIASLVLSEGVQDRPVKLYGYDAAATGAADVVWLADALCASASVTPQAVRIELRGRAEMTVCPRTFINEANFGTLLPSGTALKINGRDFTLARRD